jgi:hypothetical protein
LLVTKPEIIKEHQLRVAQDQTPFQKCKFVQQNSSLFSLSEAMKYSSEVQCYINAFGVKMQFFIFKFEKLYEYEEEYDAQRIKILKQ